MFILVYRISTLLKFGIRHMVLFEDIGVVLFEISMNDFMEISQLNFL